MAKFYKDIVLWFVNICWFKGMFAQFFCKCLHTSMNIYACAKPQIESFAIQDGIGEKTSMHLKKENVGAFLHKFNFIPSRPCKFYNSTNM